jgi:hypothetical protein
MMIACFEKMILVSLFFFNSNYRIFIRIIFVLKLINVMIVSPRGKTFLKYETKVRI